MNVKCLLSAHHSKETLVFHPFPCQNCRQWIAIDAVVLDTKEAFHWAEITTASWLRIRSTYVRVPTVNPLISPSRRSNPRTWRQRVVAGGGLLEHFMVRR